MIHIIEMSKVNITQLPIGHLLLVLVALALASQILKRNKIDVEKSLLIILSTTNKLSKVNKIMLLPTSTTS